MARLPGAINDNAKDGYMCYICGEVDRIAAFDWFSWSPPRAVCHGCKIKVVTRAIEEMPEGSGHLPS